MTPLQQLLYKLKFPIPWGTRKKPETVVYLYCYISQNRGDQAVADAIQQLIAGRIGNVIFKKVDWSELNPDRVDEINRTGDLFLLAGGGFYRCTEDREYNLTVLPAHMEHFKAITIPMIGYALGFNRNFMQSGESLEMRLSKTAVDILKDFNSLLHFSSVRDQKTVRFFNQIGIGNVRLCPDPAMFLEAGESNFRADRTKLNIGLNIANHGGSTAWMIDRIITAILSLIRKLENRYLIDYYYFRHEPGEDSVINMLRQNGVPLTVVDGEPGELLIAYKKMDIAICQMMHSSILAFNALVPAVCIAYDIKHFAFAELMDKRELCLRGDIFSTDDLIATVVYAIENRNHIRKELARRKRRLWRMEKKCLKTITLPRICKSQ